jgi:amidase
VGLRPSLGRVPEWPTRNAWQTLNVHGPMGRTAADVALALSVMAGPDARSPLTGGSAGDVAPGLRDRDWRDVRVAWTPDLGRYPVDPVVIDVCQRAVAALEGLGCRIDTACPDVDGADETFQILRAAYFAAEHAHHLEHHRHLLKETVVWNIEQGLALSAAAVAAAEARRTVLYHHVRAFLERYDFLVLPVAQVPPFAIEEQWVSVINGVPMRSYIDWMASCYVITLTGLPAASVPAGFTADGLPVGLQIVGRHQRDLEVLQLAHALEGVTQHWRRHPVVAEH